MGKHAKAIETGPNDSRDPFGIDVFFPGKQVSKTPTTSDDTAVASPPTSEKLATACRCSV
jgi:hypothetical protein